MPKSGEQGNSKGTSGKHLGVEETAAFLLSTLWVSMSWPGAELVTKNGRTWALGRKKDRRKEEVRRNKRDRHDTQIIITRSPRPDHTEFRQLLDLTNINNFTHKIRNFPQQGKVNHLRYSGIHRSNVHARVAHKATQSIFIHPFDFHFVLAGDNCPL